MKKFALTIAALVTAAMGFTAKADDIFFVGTPNNFQHGNSEEWLLKLDEDDPSLLTGTFYIPAGEFNFCFDLWGWGMAYLSPASGQETVVEFTDNEYLGDFELASSPICWIYPEWEGGDITVDVAIDNIAGNGTVAIYLADQEPGDGSGEDGDGTKVDSLKTGPIAKGVFNLNGVKVGESDNLKGLPGGVYIINGKKVVNPQ
ncbi:MAG: hypothetical protein J1D77_06970 [Muribaculaceae bacterium]|nr:hypothetical protein [Muribaculaceae bacterium]